MFTEYEGFTMRPVDLQGRPVERTKASHPYNYSGFVQHRWRKNQDGMTSAYTDRMRTWDPEAFDRARKAAEVRGDLFGQLRAAQWEAFLAAYYRDRDLNLVAVMEWCNVSNGHPLWSLHWTGEIAPR